MGSFISVFDVIKGATAKRCAYCGGRYEPEWEQEDFEGDIDYGYHYSYSNFKIDLCCTCAKEAINDKVDGIYFEECYGCGCEFDPFTEGPVFEKYREGQGYFEDDLSSYWEGNPLCMVCVCKKEGF